jgi:hypothetical protein
MSFCVGALVIVSISVQGIKRRNVLTSVNGIVNIVKVRRQGHDLNGVRLVTPCQEENLPCAGITIILQSVLEVGFVMHVIGLSV